MPYALDLDGVIWLADEPIAGAAGAVRRLREAGEPVLFVTNNSRQPVDVVEHALARQGVEARGDVVTSAMAVARLVAPGERVLVCAGEGVRQALLGVDAVPVQEGTADAVIVGLHFDFDYERLRTAAGAVRDGARLLATNDDPTYPTPSGPLPGGGAILAAVERATGAVATIAGKPHPPMADLVRDRLGPTGTMVGDRPDTDGRFARALGYRFALVLSGSTDEEDASVPADDVAPDLATLVDRLAIC